MKKITNILYWLAMLAIAFWFAYTKGWIFASFKSIGAKEALILIEKDHNISILDVRSIAEYKEGHLRNATLIPLDRLKENLHKLESVKGKHILVYCRSGNRSISASRLLQSNGFSPLNVKGGIIAFIQNKATIIP